MPLNNVVILILDPRRSMFPHELCWSIEARAGSCVIAQDAEAANRQCQRFSFTAAAVHIAHAAWALNLGVAHTVYGEEHTTRDIASALACLLRA